MKTVNVVEGIAFTEDLIKQLQYLQEKETHERMVKDTISLNKFIVKNLDFDNTEDESRNYIIWLHFLNDIKEFLESFESAMSK